jgi:hypothetical protein
LPSQHSQDSQGENLQIEP